MKLETIVDRILELLAEKNGRDVTELRAELEALGPELPAATTTSTSGFAHANSSSARLPKS